MPIYRCRVSSEIREELLRGADELPRKFKDMAVLLLSPEFYEFQQQYGGTINGDIETIQAYNVVTVRTEKPLDQEGRDYLKSAGLTITRNPLYALVCK